MANDVLGETGCCGDPWSRDCDKPWRLDLALSRYGHFDNWSPGPAANAVVRRSVAKDNVVAIRIQFRTLPVSHFIAISGYSGGGSYFTVRDPKDPTGTVRTETYPDLINDYDKDGDWRETIFTKP